MREFRSKFVGKCAKCHGVINIGDPISWDRKAARGQRTWHKDCASSSPSPVVDDRPAPSNPVPVMAVVEHTILEKEDHPMPSNNVDKADNALEGLAKALTPFMVLPEQKHTIDEAQVKAIVDKALAGFLAPTVVRIETPDKEPVTLEGVHKAFAKALAVVSDVDPVTGMHESLYMRGPSGSGKSTIAKHIAKALGLPFYMIPLNVQTADYKILGTIDAHNEYRPTPFRHAYEKGGVFLIDEMDNGSGNTSSTLNAALANGHMTFADGVLVERHKDFICIATGNTAGRGASRLHSERRALDAATLDRFFSMLIDYDWTLVRAASLARNPKAGPWVDWVKRASEYCAEKMPTMLITPRAALVGARKALLSAIESIEELADGVAFKGIDETSRRAIVDNVKLPRLEDLR